MRSPAEALVDYLGIGELSFDVEPPERRALLIISVLPAIVVIATLTVLGYDIDRSPFDPSSYDRSFLFRLSGVVPPPAAYAGLAVMMIAGIGRISRSVGSFCFVGALVFAGLSILFGIYASTVYALVDARDFEAIEDWHARLALNFAGLAGIVAAGYAFLAFRGLAPRDGE